MGFWIFMFIMELLIPITMMIVGRLFNSKKAGEINSLYGYRTSMSMKNKETWDFAHKHCGKIWVQVGNIMLVPSILVMIACMGKSEDAVGTVGGILCGVQCVVMIVSIVPTEIALRKNFDKKGNRR